MSVTKTAASDLAFHDVKSQIHPVTGGIELSCAGDNNLLAAMGVNRFSSPHQVWMLGDSLTSASGHYGTSLQQALGASWEAKYAGVPGNTTTQMIARFVGDVLNARTAEYIIIWGGVNDIAGGASASTIKTNLKTLYTMASNTGVRVVAVTIAPFSGDAGWESSGSAARAVQDEVNTWIRAIQPGVDHVIDAYAVLVDPNTPYMLLPAYDDGGHIHLSTAGYAAIGAAVYAGVTWTPAKSNALGIGDKFHFPGVITSDNINGIETPASGYVPYTGGSANLNLGSHEILAAGGTIEASAPLLRMKAISSSNSTPYGVEFLGGGGGGGDALEAFIKQTNTTGVLEISSGRNASWGGCIAFLADLLEVMRVKKSGVSFGRTTSSAKVHIGSGTATGGTAPLKLTAGTNMTTPEDGAFEFDGTNLYFTVGAVRKTVTLT